MQAAMLPLGSWSVPGLQPKSKDNDCVWHIRDVINQLQEEFYCFIMDNLNTYKSMVFICLEVNL
ncbi:hypothetical protein K040078D81_44030 [Blautia hominis]|uniref:Uncharacterized protein n=1 Tax=Blautia hominis TaxID=2025493 RepID=A0ABQ0BFU0_9FIRM